MGVTSSEVPVTLLIPRDVYDRAADTAAREQRRVEELLSSWVEEGMESHLSTRELWERLSERYRARLEREGKLNQTPEEVIAELREQREKVANELYPD
jgi:hypothetical protein